MEKRILLIIDPQNDFIDGSLAVSGAVEAIFNLSAYIRDNKDKYDLIVMTKDWHPSSHCSFIDNGGEWPVHCVENTDGASIRPVLLDAIHSAELPSIQLTKGTNEDREEYSIFKNEESAAKLLELIESTSPCQIDCCGIALDYCVLNTIEDAIKLGIGNKLTLLKEFSPAIGDPDTVYKKLEDEEIPII